MPLKPVFETKVENDLYLTMFPVNEENGKFWNDYKNFGLTSSAHDTPYLSAQARAKLIEKGNNAPRGGSFRNTLLGLRDGLGGMIPWLPSNKFNSYIALASYTPIDPEKPDFEQIEITVSVSDPDYPETPFFSNTGIARTYSSLQDGKPTHKGVSILLHAFVAQCMLILHKHNNPKRYMINTPAPVMTHILINALTEKKQEHGFFLFDKHQIPESTIEECEQGMIKSKDKDMTGYYIYSNDKFILEQQKANTLSFIDSDTVKNFNVPTICSITQNLRIGIDTNVLANLAVFPNPITNNAGF